MTSHLTFRSSHRTLALLLAAALGASGAWAEKPEWAGGGKDRDGPPGQMKKQDRDDRGERRIRRDNDDGRWDRSDDRPGPRAERGDRGNRAVRDDRRDRREARDRGPVVVIQPGGFFNDGQRRHAHQWYGEQYRAGHCPPGLAKKNNGCMPPGQAKKWRVGQRLPAGVVYYPVPQPVVVQLGLPPAGYRYVRVANDILLMAIGTRMVVDAITDLGRIL